MQLLALNLIIIIFLILYTPIAKNLNQYTPDTYVYEFIARSIFSDKGVKDLGENFLLLRGINLPVIWGLFSPNFNPIYLPIFLFLLLFLTYLYFSFKLIKKYNIYINNSFTYFLIISIFIIFITSLQGFYSIFYMTTHIIIAINVVIFFGTIYQISLFKEKFKIYHFLILFCCTYVFCFIRPEGIFLTFFALLYVYKKLRLEKKYVLLFFNFYFFTSSYWYFSLYNLFKGLNSLLLFIFFLIVTILFNSILFLFFNYFKDNIVRITYLIYITFIMICFTYSYSIIFKTLNVCARIIFLNEGGLGVIPIIFLLLPLYFKLSKVFENNSLIYISLLGIFLTYLIYPVLNQNSWYCDNAGWGGSLPRAWVHFLPLFAIGVVVSIFPKFSDKKLISKF
jgi:hypothetical protein